MENLAKRYENIKLDKTCPVCGKPTPRLIPPADDDLPIGECCFSCFMAALDEHDFNIAGKQKSPRLEAWSTLVDMAREAATSSAGNAADDIDFPAIEAGMWTEDAGDAGEFTYGDADEYGDYPGEGEA